MASVDDRKKALIAAFAALDSQKNGKIPTPLVMKLVSMFDTKFSEAEKQEFEQEADMNGFIHYDKFVNEVIFAKKA